MNDLHMLHRTKMTNKNSTIALISEDVLILIKKNWRPVRYQLDLLFFS